MIDYGNLPNNSDKAKLMDEADQAPKKKEKIISGAITQTKQPLPEKLKGLINPIDNLGTYLVDDVIKPGINNWLHTMLSATIDAIFGKGSAPISRQQSSNYIFRSSYGGIVDYSKYSQPNKARTEKEPDKVVSLGTRNYNSYIFHDKNDAENVRDALINVIESYGSVCVNDYYEFLGITGDPTGQKYGWKNLSEATVKPYGYDAWKIDLPKIIPLN